MTSAILVHPSFDGHWPHSADHARRVWARGGPVRFTRLSSTDTRTVGEILRADGADIRRLVALGVPFTAGCLASLPDLREVAFGQGFHGEGGADAAAVEALKKRDVRIISHPSEGFWGESVSEFGLALTLCGLRRIPQTHHAMINSHAGWDYAPANGIGTPGARGIQFGDDPRFTSGTLEGKRVRVVGAGNIASRYASFCAMLGADVAAWDPFASEPSFHRAGTRREYFLDRLVRDAEIFAALVPLLKSTEGLVTAAHIDALPKGCLVVLVTRANICDMAAVRRRVLADEIALAADVFDVEPLPLNDPLLGRHNVVHTPHNAGRTRQANENYINALFDQFS